MDVRQIEQELESARRTFHDLVAQASPESLRRRSDGTRWTNRQLLYHMVFGYLIVRTLVPLVRTLGRLGWSRRFAAALDACRGPFHLINYLGSCLGGQILPTGAVVILMDRTISALQRRLRTASQGTLALTMHVPTRWDPYFTPTMSVLDVYHYGTQHFDHHRRQLTL
ncbi:DinB family protein [Occultella gossypii]|uniref:DinB family protein n=1 Tax=Occultella gossypii TaxID=2800820 RepID=A0ABS7S362_9MICO|nr:DinB family protein [Occultella gossypii]MBZ2194777.1 DinB family protein [Occultella gossypii]